MAEHPPKGGAGRFISAARQVSRVHTCLLVPRICSQHMSRHSASLSVWTLQPALKCFTWLFYFWFRSILSWCLRTLSKHQITQIKARTFHINPTSIRMVRSHQEYSKPTGLDTSESQEFIPVKFVSMNLFAFCGKWTFSGHWDTCDLGHLQGTLTAPKRQLAPDPTARMRPFGFLIFIFK